MAKVDAPRDSWLASALALLRRHVWSLSTSALSALCFVQLAVEIREGELVQFDALMGQAIARWRGTLDPLMLGLTRLGTGESLIFITALLVGWLSARARRKEATYLVLAAGGTWLFNLGLKLLFHRARPDSAASYLVTTPNSFSFPSGHAMCSVGVLAGLAVVVQNLGWPRAPSRLLAAGCLLLAVAVGTSRVYLGVHFASDVLGGQLAAAAWVSALTGWFYPRLLPGERAELGPAT
jgi:undecaprenyl-diphosphatase